MSYYHPHACEHTVPCTSPYWHASTRGRMTCKHAPARQHPFCGINIQHTECTMKPHVFIITLQLCCCNRVCAVLWWPVTWLHNMQDSTDPTLTTKLNCKTFGSRTRKWEYIHFLSSLYIFCQYSSSLNYRNISRLQNWTHIWSRLEYMNTSYGARTNSPLLPVPPHRSVIIAIIN